MADPADRTEHVDPTAHTEGSTPVDTPAAHTDVISTADDPTRPRRRGPDPIALVVGLATLAMAVFAFVGELPDLDLDPRWLLAGGAAVVGLLLLVGNLRGRSGGRRSG